MKPLFFYLGGAAVFFALCGYAQGNDPDPALWVSLYVFGGCVLNLLVALVIISPTTKERQLGVLVKLLCQSFLVLCLGYAVHLAYFLVQDPRMVVAKETTWLWSMLELEEGREISGLGMLALHQLVLLSFLSSNKKTNRTNQGAEGFSWLPLVGSLIGMAAVVMASGAWLIPKPNQRKRSRLTWNAASKGTRWNEGQSFAKVLTSRFFKQKGRVRENMANRNTSRRFCPYFLHVLCVLFLLCSGILLFHLVGGRFKCALAGTISVSARITCLHQEIQWSEDLVRPMHWEIYLLEEQLQRQAQLALEEKEETHKSALCVLPLEFWNPAAEQWKVAPGFLAHNYFHSQRLILTSNRLLRSTASPESTHLCPLWQIPPLC
ncbi:hypothetical protein QOT17_008520 [Balamuthia mandrillaris]